MDADLFTDGPPAARAGWLDAARAHLDGLRVPGWLNTLKARLALGAVAALMLGMAATAWQLSAHAERGFLAQAQVREQAQARYMAAEIGRRLGELNGLLAHMAQKVETGWAVDPQRLSRLLDDSALLGPYFSTLYAAAPDGRILSFVDAAGPRYPETSLQERAYFRQAVQTGQPVISPSVAGRISGEPVVVMSHPVVRDGQVVAVVGGALRLASRDLIQQLAGSPAQVADAVLVLTTADGTVLAHPERRFLFGPMQADARLAPAYERRQRALESGAPGLNAWTLDDEVAAMAVDEVAGWQVWRLVPQAALLAPLRQARALAVRDAAMVVVVLASLIVLLLVWQLRPLARLERRAASLLTGDGTGDWPQSDGEIGRLARTLQHVWAERSQMEAFNQQVLQKLGSVMAAAPVGLAFERNQCFELVSAEFSHLLGFAEADVLGQRTQLIFASHHDHEKLGTQVAEAFAAGQPYSGEWELLRADGSRFWGLLRARPVEQGVAAAGTIWSINDVSEQVESRRQLQHAAHHDALTGVVNRQGFDQAVQALFDSQPASRPAALVMIDLDHFKPINDTAGHAAGDAMLVAVAQAIASRVRTTDLVVRLGGDEFALLLTRCNHERALAVAEKVREAITDLALTWEAHTLRVGASLGVAELTEHHQSPAQWLAQADAACYDAKRAGRGTVRTARQTLRVVGSP
jgi:diguanylate cyclase (GGDEF)-like protein/PAS domain S-box-containing protein